MIQNELPLADNSPDYADVFWLKVDFPLSLNEDRPRALVDFCDRVMTPEDCALLSAVITASVEDIVRELEAKAHRLIRERSAGN